MKMIKKNYYTLWTYLLCLGSLMTIQAREVSSSCSNFPLTDVKAPKRIILFYADDLGYGDTGVYGAKAIPTPNVDKLAAQGLKFTDAHCSSATCTPSRYALMTGQYPWRQAGVHILPGDAPCIIPSLKKQLSLPEMLRKAGYHTGAVGKWHLGMGNGNVDWNKKIPNNVNDVGFDETFMMAATADRVPCVYIRNGLVENLDPQDPIEVSYKKNFPGEPTGRDNPELLRMQLSHGHDQTILNGISRIGFMKGGKKARWDDRNMADDFLREAKNFIQKNKEKKFFLYFATNDIHVPRDPNARFIGKSQCGVRGDVTVQMDYCLQEIMSFLKEKDLLDDTLIIFTSDNGPVVDDGYADGSVRDLGDHKPAGILRGGKYSVYEGGTRIPMIVWWPGTVCPGVSDALISQIDFAASLAALVGQDYAKHDFVDSQNILPALLGKTTQARQEYVEQGTNEVALRQGAYKYIPQAQNQGKLYDLSVDISEKQDLSSQYPEIVKRMAKRLKEIREKNK